MKEGAGFYTDTKLSTKEKEFTGAFFTPQIWVEKSQEYLSKVLGADWQDNYYVWDCCAGTGNMENGLTNADNVFASTLEDNEVEEIKSKIDAGLPLKKDHIFQFDFLNDELDSDKVPQELRDIIKDEEKRKKLVIYINPPFAESGNRKAVVYETEGQKTGVSKTKTHTKYVNTIGKGFKELFVQFLFRIYYEIPGCWIGQFSTHKHIYSENFIKFRQNFLAKLYKGFLVPANTFYGVKGKFPIGFFIWNTNEHETIGNVTFELFDRRGKYIREKKLFPIQSTTEIMSRWLMRHNDTEHERLASLAYVGSDFQHNTSVHLTMRLAGKDRTHNAHVTLQNLHIACIFFATRYAIPMNWENNRDNYMEPTSDKWKDDNEFIFNCIVYTILHAKNIVKSSDRTNHWIPFTEDEVGANGVYESHTLINYLKQIELSPEATSVMNWRRELYRYYHSMDNVNVNASFYEIREYFCGRDENGIMVRSSKNTRYNQLIKSLKSARYGLRDKIVPKIREYGFLRIQ